MAAQARGYTEITSMLLRGLDTKSYMEHKEREKSLIPKERKVNNNTGRGSGKITKFVKSSWRGLKKLPVFFCEDSMPNCAWSIRRERKVSYLKRGKTTTLVEDQGGIQRMDTKSYMEHKEREKSLIPKERKVKITTLIEDQGRGYRDYLVCCRGDWIQSRTWSIRREREKSDSEREKGKQQHW